MHKHPYVAPLSRPLPSGSVAECLGLVATGGDAISSEAMSNFTVDERAFTGCAAHSSPNYAEFACRSTIRASTLASGRSIDEHWDVTWANRKT